MIHPIKKHRFTRKKIVIATCILLLILVASAIVYYSHRDRTTKSTTNPVPQKPINYTPPTSDQVTTGDQIKKQSVDSQQQNNDTSPSTPTPVMITSINQSSGVIYIRSIIQKVTNSGSCTLTMSNNTGGSYTTTSKVQAMASSSTCEGFNIPSSKLSPGNWSITITFSDGLSSGSASGSVTVHD